jgi:hypothetical protein
MHDSAVLLKLQLFNMAGISRLTLYYDNLRHRFGIRE